MAKQTYSSFWTNPSVLSLGSGSDPIETVTAMARDLVFRALERGWNGPPFDPFALAELLGIETVPTFEVSDARTVPISADRYRIEYNPDRPRRRMRYSIFHEIAHTMFPDCAQMIRNRGSHMASRRDDWQLETLCNIAAAEFLLPTGALGKVSNLLASVETILDLRKRYEASAEAALLRIARLTAEQTIAFSCHRDITSTRYVVDYSVPTGNLNWELRPGSVLPMRTAATECTAIGYTAKQTENWHHLGQVQVECVGVAPFPRNIYPRVIGFARPSRPQPQKATPITYVRGDATQTRGTDRKLLVQVVNDSAFTWGATGFVAAIKQRWPSAQKAYTSQVTGDRNLLRLGSLVLCDVEPDLTLVSLVAQHGYGPSPRPRIRYGALRSCLLRVAKLAKELNANVHMPRIGTGQAGGAWPVVEEIVSETLTRADIKVLVYDLPQGRERPKPQADLAFNA